MHRFLCSCSYLFSSSYLLSFVDTFTKNQQLTFFDHVPAGALQHSNDGTDRRTDRRTPNHYIDPAPHTVRSVNNCAYYGYALHVIPTWLLCRPVYMKFAVYIYSVGVVKKQFKTCSVWGPFRLTQTSASSGSARCSTISYC